MKALELRQYLIKILSWEEAHSSFEMAIKDIPEEDLGKKISGLDYTIWQLAYHIQFANHDILEFCTNSNYKAPAWPDDYWPKSKNPESSQEWSKLCKKIADDRKAFIQILNNPQIDLFKPITYGQGQDIFREIMLVVDHSSYHIGQIVLLRKLLGNWQS